MAVKPVSRRVVILSLGAAAAAVATGSPAFARTEARLRTSIVSDALRVTNVVPTWGAQIPKVVFDGRWYYAATLDGAGAEYPWQARVWKSRDSQNWTEAVRLPGHVYQPVGLLVDGAGRLHLHVACYTGAEAFPGVAPKPGDDMASVYAIRLQFDARLRDGSVDFTRFTDHTVRTGSTERYYQGLAVSRDGRYLYSAYAVDGWDLYLNQFDTRTGRDVHSTRIGTPPAGRAWLYPRVQPGKHAGDVHLSFSQYVLGTPNSAYLDGATLWHSTDGGRTFAGGYLTRNPAPDGDRNWVDASDLTVDVHGTVHAVFYRRDDGVGTLYYQRGAAGSPVPVGPLDNHSQIVARPDGTLVVLSSDGADLVVATSRNGRDWRLDRHTVPGVSAAYWPNLLQARSGSRTPPGHGVSMLMAGQRSGDPSFHPLLFVTLR
ncbi:hypothetical protein [Dactylosporangium fulvum]|uniref:Uncharacterized protein n=1 Tax=Dactylosporangium fulvum TaxID=53359 RepID=A0ABY5W8H0_9ACTN|nr:hypothetical protein [Dactylosporangium fulvum]UWP85304.1 hypothetical protein Dfulv_14145 [Dactylosporangium fulvum]